MKEKMTMHTNKHYFQTVLPLGCWKPIHRRKQTYGKQLLKKYQTRIHNTLAGVTIGLMFLTGIWVFLVELAEYVSK